MKKPWTVQCGYMAHFANTVTVEAASLEEALEKAIETANDDDAWRSTDHCGPTFVRRMRLQSVCEAVAGHRLPPRIEKHAIVAYSRSDLEPTPKR